MLFQNAEVMNGDFCLEKADLAVENGRIAAMGNDLPSSGETFDLEGCRIFPGLIDIHIHGCAGFDTNDATREALSKMAVHLAAEGITSFCPTTMTVSPEHIEETLANIRACMDDPPEGASILGANMEGPYISMSRKGGQNPAFVKAPDWEQFRRFYEHSGGIVKLVDIAPECVGEDGFIQRASKLCTVSIAHTDADYDQAKAAIAKGVTHVTHLYNAMPGLNHRKPGTVGAVFDDDRVRAELICDGFHVHPAALRIAFRILGKDRTVVVSDSMRAAGLPDGVYDHGGQQVFVRGGHATLADGTIAGSTSNIFTEVQNLLRFGVPLEQAIRSATINPARAVREDGVTGSIEIGKRADLLIVDGHFGLKTAVVQGKIINPAALNRIS